MYWACKLLDGDCCALGVKAFFAQNKNEDYLPFVRYYENSETNDVLFRRLYRIS
jgi:hypothetical protein